MAPLNDDDWDPTEYYGRAPPSSFTYNNNGRSRHSSMDSFSNIPYVHESIALSDEPVSPLPEDLPFPNAPFMSESGHDHSRGHSISNSINSVGGGVYQNSAGASLRSQHSNPDLSRLNNNGLSFRAPFLSPASRPSSSLWAPPQRLSPSASSIALVSRPIKQARFTSTLLPEKLTKADKPWLAKRQPRARLSHYLSLLGIFLGFAGAALLCYFELTDLDLLDESNLCTVFEDDFSSSSLDTSIWARTVELGGFGNGEFEIMTNSDDNLKIENGELYIIPTLTSDTIGNTSAIFDGYTYDLGDDCTTTNTTACSVTSDSSTKVVIPPVQSARISTNGTYSLKYGRVQVRAKNPAGDWLWPSIWMLPVNNTYGAWPLSGEIDIMEARGNGITYPAQGLNYVRSTLNYAPISSLISYAQSTLFGYWSVPRLSSSAFSESFHTYTLEWTEDWMRMYVDSRLQAMLEIDIKSSKKSLFNRLNYPSTTMNDTTGDTIAVTNIYEAAGGGWNAPFDQEFYLIIELAVGGTSGWFPDDEGDKPWTDGGGNEAMYDFAKAQSTWSSQWPSSVDDKAFRVDWVKMWKMC